MTKPRIGGILPSVLRDVPYAFRTLRNSPGFSLTVIVTLALCVGANATVLSALHGLVLKGHPFESGERLVQLFNLREARSPDNPHSESSWLQYVDLRSRSSIVEGAAKGLETASIGLALGALGAGLASRFLRRFLFDVEPWDAGTFAGAAGLFALATVVACLLPARGAARVDPLESVRGG